MEHDIEHLLSHQAPDLVLSAIPKAESIVGRQQRARRTTRALGLGTTCLLVCCTSWQLLSYSSQEGRVGRPGGSSEGLQEVSEPEFVLIAEANQAESMAPRWRLELGEVTESGSVPLVLNSAIPETSQVMVIGYVTPPQAVEIPVWQLAPADQETLRAANQVAEWSVPTEL